MLEVTERISTKLGHIYTYDYYLMANNLSYTFPEISVLLNCEIL